MKKRILYLLIPFVILVCVAFRAFAGNYDTKEKREEYLSRKQDGILITSEVSIGEDVISEVRCNGQIGYAVFRNEGIGYTFRHLSMREKEVFFDLNVFGDTTYHIAICDKPGLERAEITYTDTLTDDVIECDSVELDGDTMALFKAPDCHDYSASVVFYDSDGNEYAY